MKKAITLPIAPILALNIAMATCTLTSRATPATPDTETSTSGPAAPSTPSAPEASETDISAILAAAPASIGSMTLDLPVVTEIYRQNSQARLWTNEKGLSKNGKFLLKSLPLQAELHGMRTSYYLTADIKERLKSQEPQVLAELDILLTQAFATLLKDVSIGRIKPEDPAQNVQDIEMKKNAAPEATLLYSLMTTPEQIDFATEIVRPQTAAYLNLVHNLRLLEVARLRGGGWPAFNGQPILRPGDAHPNVIGVRTRLVDLGFLARENRSSRSTEYDSALARAVALFQSRNLLSADAIIGAGTYKALDISLERAIGRVRANMEKWRFFPRNLPSRFIFVDMGRQELDVMEDNKLVDRMRVVVGRDIHGTPTMADKITSVIVNPYWFPPASIIGNEIVPKAQRDPSYLRRMRMRIFDSRGQEVDPSAVNWSQYSAANPPPFKFRQDAGRYAALGLLKFNLTNSHAIYLHDTDDRSVFNRSVRYLSHGCIRVQRPVDLATYLLRDQGITSEDLKADFADPEIQAKKLKIDPIPTLILGTTLTSYPDGSLVFGPDIYGQDGRVVNAMDGKVAPGPLVPAPSKE